MARIAVVGANGRVGAALVGHLSARHEVVPITRNPGETAAELASRAASGVDIVVNAAGVAHVERETLEEIERLRAGNVELPLALARAALDAGAHVVHISSVKAVADAKTAYGRSKFEGDQSLEVGFGDLFAEAGLSLVIVRPLALLFPPFDEGRIARLTFLKRWPLALTPPIPLPVLAPATLVNTIDELVGRALGRDHVGAEIWRFGPRERGNLRDIKVAVSA